MPAKRPFFLDTNIFVYSFSTTDPGKRDRSRTLIAEAIETGQGIISSQVVQEFLNVASRKFKTPLKPADCRRYLETVLNPLCRVYPSIELYKEALSVMERWGFGFYDSLIVSAALASRCRILYTEDLSDSQEIRDLKIVNPFR